MSLSCDGCTECCYYLAVPALDKPNCVDCRYLEEGYGCNVYEERPEACRTFSCMWLQTQTSRTNAWPKIMRPDKCGVMFVATTSDNTIAAHTREPDDLDDNPTITKRMNQWLRNGLRVVHVVGPQRRLLALVRAS
jgi:uncharacterized cysteine cluster protein YcgN (CxxCxxCC family)